MKEVGFITKGEATIRVNSQEISKFYTDLIDQANRPKLTQGGFVNNMMILLRPYSTTRLI